MITVGQQITNIKFNNQKAVERCKNNILIMSERVLFEEVEVHLVNEKKAKFIGLCLEDSFDIKVSNE